MLVADYTGPCPFFWGHSTCCCRTPWEHYLSSCPEGWFPVPPKLLTAIGLFSIFTGMLNFIHKWAESPSLASNAWYHSPLSQSNIACSLSLKWILENGYPLNLFQKLLSFCEESDLFLVVRPENSIYMVFHLSTSLFFLSRQPHKTSSLHTIDKSFI